MKSDWVHNYRDDDRVWVLVRIDGIDMQLPGIVVGMSSKLGEVYISVLGSDGISHVAIENEKGIGMRPQGVVSVAGKEINKSTGREVSHG